MNRSMRLTAKAATRNLPGMDEGKEYDAEYFLRGRQTGRSLYENYRWLPKLTIPMAERIVEHCGIRTNQLTLDFGCARGYLIKALTKLGFEAVGHDISTWAVENADPEIRHLIERNWPPTAEIDWIIAKDVLEHIDVHDIGRLLRQFGEVARAGIFVVVPLSNGLGKSYVVEEYDHDVTHRLRWPLDQWVGEFHDALDHTWEISARYRIEGIKDNYADWEVGNGFITCRKIGCAG